MNRLIDGYRRWLGVGVNPPTSVIKETDEAIRESNQTLEFLEACSEETVEGSAPAGQLYAAYHAWFSYEHGTKPMSRPAFKTAMERTLKRQQGRGSGNRFWPGIVLKKR